MRVYEYAKEKGVSAKDVLAKLRKGGFEVASHMALLAPDALAYLASDSESSKKEKSAPKGSAHAAPQSAEEKPKMIQSVLEKPVSPKVVATKPEQEKPEQHAALADSGVEKKVSSTVPFLKKVTSPAPAVKPESAKEESETTSIVIPLQPTILSDFASSVNKSFTDVIFTLLKWKILSNKNQLLPIDLIQRLADHYQVTAVRPVVAVKEESVAGRVQAQHGAERLPVVVVMGHVDHGKTTLLDYIRKTRVAAREKGGITQHLGAYSAKTPQGSVIFLDTPGHEAFSKIRMRGAKVADIAILVVAVDDGVMPQTIEAIKQARAMGTAIIVALNKIDKVDAQRIEVIKHELGQQYHLLPEEWGGDVMYVPISAKLGTNVDKLLEMIILQAQVMELKSDVAANAKGYVLESKVEKGLGTVATFIAQQGVIRIGDYFMCGNTGGRISVLIDSFGTRVQEAGSSIPVQIVGFDDLPQAGDLFEVVKKEAYLESKKKTETQKSGVAAQSRVTRVEDIRLIVKTDVASSQEAIVDGIAKMSKKLERGYFLVHAGIGKVSESDVILAADTGARIVALHVKIEQSAVQIAQRLKVNIQSFDIIYKLLEHLEAYSDSLKAVKMIRKKVGEALVRKVFDIKNLGVIAGSYVKEGIFTRDGSVVIWRGNRKVGQGPISSLQRDRRTVKEVHSGYECAFMVDGFTEWEVDDRVECFAEKPESA